MLHAPASRGWRALSATVFLAAVLAGCGGSDGAAGPAGPAGSTGPAGPAGPTGPSGPTSGVLAANFMTPEQWEAAKFSISIAGVTVASPPVVEFTVTDERGRTVEGLEQFTAKATNATIASYPNLAFALAKLTPRTSADMSRWVSYIVTNVAATTGAQTLTRPTTDNQGKLEAVAGKSGTYRYTFYRDVTTMKATVDGLSGTNKAALGDLAWQPGLPHRLVIQFGGAARGTGGNTATSAQVTPAVNMANPVNAVYDFVPATGKALTPAELTREDVNIASCNVCHGKLAIHGGTARVRVETRYCVVCHTEQRGFGFNNVASTSDASGIRFPKLTETPDKDAATGITSYSYSPDMRIADGETLGNFTTMIHKIHNGSSLVKENYNYDGIAFNNKGFSKLDGGQRMCTTCHDSKIAQNAENHRNYPSRDACGACHDGIKWDTGTGSTLEDKTKVVTAADSLPSSGHRGGAAQDDANCSSCHTNAGIRISHRMANITKNNPTIDDGLASFLYEIKEVTVNAANDTIIEFGIRQAIAPATVSSTSPLVTLAAPAAGTVTPLAGFTGGPAFLLAYTKSQDGISLPADYNNLGRRQAQPLSVTIASLLSTDNSANGSIAPSAANPGYYIATLKGSGQWKFPTDAKMRAVALQSYFSQVTAPASTAAPNGRHAISVVKEVKGDVVRRRVVDAEKCAGCHEWLELHGGSRVFEPQVCVLCHNPGLASSGRGIADSALNTWNFNLAFSKITDDWKKDLDLRFDKTLPNAALRFPVTSNNFKDMIHGIHAGRERVTPFRDARDRVSSGVIQLLDFRRMDFPGRLNDCETCHIAATTQATTTYNAVPAGALASTHESINAAYAAGIAAGTATPTQANASLSADNAADRVTTPFSAACVSCHDRDAARAHIAINGGTILGTRSAALPSTRPIEDVESCTVCHGFGREFDAAKLHKR